MWKLLHVADLSVTFMKLHLSKNKKVKICTNWPIGPWFSLTGAQTAMWIWPHPRPGLSAPPPLGALGARKGQWVPPPRPRSCRASYWPDSSSLSTPCFSFYETLRKKASSSLPSEAQVSQSSSLPHPFTTYNLARSAKDESMPPPATRQNCQLNQRDEIGSSRCLWLSWP